MALQVKRALIADSSLAGKVSVGVSGKTVTLSGNLAGPKEREAAFTTAARSAPRYTVIDSLHTK